MRYLLFTKYFTCYRNRNYIDRCFIEAMTWLPHSDCVYNNDRMVGPSLTSVVVFCFVVVDDASCIVGQCSNKQKCKWLLSHERKMWESSNKTLSKLLECVLLSPEQIYFYFFQMRRYLEATGIKNLVNIHLTSLTSIYVLSSINVQIIICASCKGRQRVISSLKT